MLQKTGRKLHRTTGKGDLAIVISEALIAELGSSHRAVKTAMSWTGASERTVKHWLAATHVPKGNHLVSLARHSDEVLSAILIAAGRSDLRIALELSILRTKMLEVAALLEGS